MGKKPKNQTAPVPGELSKNVFLEFLTTTANTKQRVADAQTDHAREFKKCESLGIHSEAAKLLQKLNKMSEEKRADFLHFFDKARPWMGWDEQLDLLEHAEAQAGEDDDVGEEPVRRTASDDDRETVFEPAGLTFGSDEAEERDPMLEETAQAWAEPQNDEGSEEDLDQGGYTFAEGKSAGLAGAGPDANPHLSGHPSPSVDIWERGRVAGARERVTTEAAAIADELDAEESTVDEEPMTTADIVNLFGDDGDGYEEPPTAEVIAAAGDAPQAAAQA